MDCFDSDDDNASVLKYDLTVRISILNYTACIIDGLKQYQFKYRYFNFERSVWNLVYELLNMNKHNMNGCRYYIGDEKVKECDWIV